MAVGAFVTCPKCGLEQPAGEECRRCGVVFARIRPDAATVPSSPPAVVVHPRRGRGRLLVAIIALVLAGAAVAAVMARAHRPAPRRADDGPAPLPAEQAAVVDSFRAYRQALASGEPAAVRQCLIAARRGELDGADADRLLAAIAALTPPSYEVTRLEVAGDDATLALAGSFEGQPATGTAVLRREHGAWLLARESWEVKLGFGASGAPVEVVHLAELSGGEPVEGLATLADRFLPAPGQRYARRFDVGPDHTPAVVATLTGHTDAVESLGFTPDSDKLVSASSGDRTLCLSRVDGALVTCVPTAERVADLAVSPDGSAVYTIDAYQHLLAWPLLEDVLGAPVELARTPDGERLGLDVSPNGAVVATVGGLGDHGSISLWDPASRSLLSALEVDHALRDVAFSPDGRFLVAVGTGRALLLFDLARGSGRRYEVEGPAADSETLAVAISPDGRHLATAHNDSSLSVWDLASGRQLHDLFVKDASAMDLAFSADGKILASAQADDAVYLWDVATGKRLARLSGHAGSPLALAFSPDGRLLASADRDGSILLWR